MRYEGPHWSATQFMCFEQCPAEYKKRYVDGEAIELTEALCFGKAVHLGLEAHFNGEDGERLFRAVWKSEIERLDGKANRNLTGIGLGLLDKVKSLDLKGVAEHPFLIDTELALGKVTVGAIDLWDAGAPDRPTVLYDFKTTRGQWSQERAQSELWQPILYSWAALEASGRIPAFEYIVLNRITGQLDRFRRSWTEEQWGKQWDEAYDRMRSIAKAVTANELVCHGKHGYCPECGARWAHDHVCDEPTSKRIQLGLMRSTR